MENTRYGSELASRKEGLNAVLEEVFLFYRQNLDFSRMVYTDWNAKDVLGHITFWHESFARNVRDVSLGKKPNPLKGRLSEVNQTSVNSTREVPIPQLLERMKVAQKIIEQHVGDPMVKKIPYKKGSRDYTPLEHLEIVEGHIRKHLRDLKKKFEYGEAKK